MRLRLNARLPVADKNGVRTRFNSQTEKAGKEWLAGFLRRNSAISLRQPEATSIARAAGLSQLRLAGLGWSPVAPEGGA